MDTRIATVVLAMVLAVVSMPVMCGWVVTDARAAMTMDICHPAQSIDVGHAALFAPVPPLLSIHDGARDAVLAIDAWSAPVAGRLGEAPELPPPETLA